MSDTQHQSQLLPSENKFHVGNGSIRRQGHRTAHRSIHFGAAMTKPARSVAKAHVWVVEVNVKGRYEPQVRGLFIYEENAYTACRALEIADPQNKYRVRRYERQP